MSEQTPGTGSDGTEGDEAEEPRDVDVFDNAEVETVQGEQTSYVSRASGGGSPPEDQDETTHQPDTTGTAGGDPLGGVTAGEDAPSTDGAVSGDTGPEHSGQHGSGY
ncbi:hypothetical protein WDZ17_04060 [Pseudokineococcus basanitobsidens]|uniref:Uncharacterized protein n=1 Tax=Pseudokineococcus basanitobsidens TaxID=1926649 RepID=A0ABU8RHA0_9ACTN